MGGIHFLFIHSATVLGEGQILVNWPISPWFARAKAIFVAAGEESTNFGISSNFFTNLEGGVFKCLMEAATRAWKAHASMSGGGSGGDGPPDRGSHCWSRLRRRVWSDHSILGSFWEQWEALMWSLRVIKTGVGSILCDNKLVTITNPSKPGSDMRLEFVKLGVAYPWFHYVNSTCKQHKPIWVDIPICERPILPWIPKVLRGITNTRCKPLCV